MIAVLRALAPYLRPYRRTLTFAAAAMVGEIVTAILSPWPLKFLFDKVLLTGPHHQLTSHLGSREIRVLAIITVAAIVIAVADAVFTYYDDQLTEVASQRAVFELRKDVFAHLQRQSVAFHHAVDTRLGDLLSRLNGDVGALQDLAADGVSNVVTNGFTLLLITGVLFWLDWLMATAAVLIVVPMALYTRRTSTAMRQAMRAARRHEGRVSAVVQESLTFMKLVQAYGREDHEREKLATESDLSLSANIRAGTLVARLTPTVSLVSATGTALLSLLGVWQVVQGRISPGVLLVFLSYLRSMQSPIRQLAKLSWAVSKAGASLERVQEVLHLQSDVRDRPGARAIRHLRGYVEFRNVTVGYVPNRPVLHNVSLEAEGGQLVALVGATGSGKSTLLSLLPRFYDPWGGAVLVDGTDVRDISLRSLRENIAVVLQESLIFRTSILENIAYGRPNATRDQVIEAAETAGVGLIVARFEDGYDTVVSERGASLSGGEKQCIGIARALLKNAPIVILDEPTSSMDPLTERLVMTGIERLMRGRTGFVIAHRLTTVERANQVAVLDHGRIVEMGSPANLLSDPTSRFSRLGAAQALRTPK